LRSNRTVALKETTNITKHPKKNENYNKILENPFNFNPPLPLLPESATNHVVLIKRKRKNNIL
jgi:hypothetical protein